MPGEDRVRHDTTAAGLYAGREDVLRGRLAHLRSDVTIPHLREGDPRRIVVEAYPGVLARAVTTESYKNDNRKQQTPGQREARGRILEALTSGALSGRYGLTAAAKPEFSSKR